MEIKKGQVWVNVGFEHVYRSKFYHSVVRILVVNGDEILVRSLADTYGGEFAYGGPQGKPFYLSKKEMIDKGRFRPFKKEDLHRFTKSRILNKVLYGNRN